MSSFSRWDPCGMFLGPGLEQGRGNPQRKSYGLPAQSQIAWLETTEMKPRSQTQQIRVWGSVCRGNSKWVGESGSRGSVLSSSSSLFIRFPWSKEGLLGAAKGPKRDSKIEAEIMAVLWETCMHIGLSGVCKPPHKLPLGWSLKVGGWSGW